MSSPILTISLLCPGRTEDVFKTLDSIVSILKNVPSELIIVDTGCPEEFRKRLEKYTDKIIPFAWTGDFAEARNIGLNAAGGKWFMFIDDDEWFENVDPIIHFFNSSEYTRYDGASYFVRNYYDYDMTGYDDTPVSRIFKIKSGCQFTGKIHENYSAQYNKVKLLNCFVHHFGYVYKNDEERMAHSIRNIIPLREILEENDNDMHARYQLVQEYCAIRDWQLLYDECKIAIAKYSSVGGMLKNKVPTFYIGMIMSLLNQRLYEDAYSVYIDAIKFDGLTNWSKAKLYVLIIHVLINLDKFDEAIRVVEDYQKLLMKEKTIDDNILTEQCFLSEDAFNQDSINYMRKQMLLLAFIKQDKSKFEGFFQKIDWNLFYTEGTTKDFISDIVQFLVENNLESDQLVMAEKLINKIENAASTRDYLSEKLEECKINEKLKSNLTRIESDNLEISHIKALVALEKNKTDDAARFLKKAVDKGYNIYQLDECFWNCFADGRLNLTEIIKDIDSREFVASTNKLIRGSKDDDILDKLEIIIDSLNEDDIKAIYGIKCMIEYQLINTPDEEFCGFDDLSNVFKLWSDLTIKFYSKYYRAESFAQYLDLMPEDCQAAVKINGFLATRDADTMTALAFLKDAAMIYICLGDKIKRLIEMYVG